MKVILLFLSLFFTSAAGNAQTAAKDVLKTLSLLTDQYDKTFASPATDEFIVIYVPGNDDPFNKIYEKWKGKTFPPSKSIQVVGGFKEMVAASRGHSSTSTDGLKKHIQEAMISRYGTKHFPILIDMESKTGTLLGVNGLSIVVLSTKDNKVKAKTDFGSDRKKFLDEVATYFNP